MSTAVGIVLLLGITITIAAVSVTFFTELGPIDPTSGSQPTAAFEFDYSGDGAGQELKISHASGDTIAMANLYVVVNDATCKDPSGPATDPTGRHSFASLGATGAEATAGTAGFVDKNRVCGGGDYLVLKRATVSVVWWDGETSKELVRWDGPFA